MQTPLKSWLLASVAVSAFLSPLAAHADETTDLQAQINQLSSQLQLVSHKLQAVEAQQAHERAVKGPIVPNA